ncbi:MAG TPA: hypothetical protein VFY12_07120 [Arenimonas sp.]|nr:hypothetical protein [Arenimonas sp.]
MTREAFDHHVGKWHRREPEMALAEVFCPAAERQRFRAWGALQFELREAVFELSDPRVTAVKTSWWAETLLALGKGQGRHPLTEALLGVAAPWSALARSVLDTPQQPQRPGDGEAALAAMRPLAQAIAEVEAALFEAQPAAADVVAVHLLLQRLPAGLSAEDAGRVPLHLLARHQLRSSDLPSAGSEPLLRDWAVELKARLPARLPRACLYRRLRCAFDGARLQRLAGGRGFAPPSALSTVWRGWRAARSR